MMAILETGPLLRERLEARIAPYRGRSLLISMPGRNENLIVHKLLILRLHKLLPDDKGMPRQFPSTPCAFDMFVARNPIYTQV